MKSHRLCRKAALTEERRRGAEAMGSYGFLVSDHRTQERFHLGVKDLKVGLPNSMCLMISDRFASDPMTLPLPPAPEV